MKKLLIVLVLVAVGFGMNSCKKYDEGPMLSLRSKKARLVNDWVLEKATNNGVDVTSMYSNDFLLSIKDDDTYALTNNGVTENGKWEFVEDKEAIKLTEGTSGTIETLNIIRLKNKEITLEQVVLTETFTIYLVAKE